MTMTREEALTIVASIVREHSRECREPKPCQDCELEAEAIAALSQPELVLTRNDAGEVVAITRQDDEHRIVETIWVAPLPQPAWRPISEAPRDGTRFVTANFNDPLPREGEYEVCHFEPYSWTNYEEVEGGLYRKVESVIREFRSDNFQRATHFTTLPAPPEAT